MDAQKHTPGPWRAWDNGHFWQVDAECAEWQGQQVADSCPSKTMYRNGVIVADHGEANARLIAAAPDFLAALNACITDPQLIQAASLTTLRNALVSINQIAADAIAKATA
jgi:hypothetical protein